MVVGSSYSGRLIQIIEMLSGRCLHKIMQLALGYVPDDKGSPMFAKRVSRMRRGQDRMMVGDWTLESSAVLASASGEETRLG